MYNDNKAMMQHILDILLRQQQCGTSSRNAPYKQQKREQQEEQEEAAGVWMHIRGSLSKSASSVHPQQRCIADNDETGPSPSLSPSLSVSPQNISKTERKEKNRDILRPLLQTSSLDAQLLQEIKESERNATSISISPNNKLVGAAARDDTLHMSMDWLDSQSVEWEFSGDVNSSKYESLKSNEI